MVLLQVFGVGVVVLALVTVAQVLGTATSFYSATPHRRDSLGLLVATIRARMANPGAVDAYAAAPGRSDFEASLEKWLPGDSPYPPVGWSGWQWRRTRAIVRRLHAERKATTDLARVERGVAAILGVSDEELADRREDRRRRLDQRQTRIEERIRNSRNVATVINRAGIWILLEDMRLAWTGLRSIALPALSRMVTNVANCMAPYTPIGMALGGVVMLLLNALGAQPDVVVYLSIGGTAGALVGVAVALIRLQIQILNAIDRPEPPLLRAATWTFASGTFLAIAGMYSLSAMGVQGAGRWGLAGLIATNVLAATLLGLARVLQRDQPIESRAKRA